MAVINNQWSSLKKDYDLFQGWQSSVSYNEIISLWGGRAEYSIAVVIGSIALKTIATGTLANFLGVVAIGGTVLFLASVIKYQMLISDERQFRRMHHVTWYAQVILGLVERYEIRNEDLKEDNEAFRKDTARVLNQIKEYSLQDIQECQNQPDYVDRKTFTGSYVGGLKDNITSIFPKMIGKEAGESLKSENPWDSGLAAGVKQLRSIETNFPTVKDVEKVGNVEEEINLIYGASIAGAIRVIDFYSAKTGVAK